jgi:hypothetical protein
LTGKYREEGRKGGVSQGKTPAAAGTHAPGWVGKHDKKERHERRGTPGGEMIGRASRKNSTWNWVAK